MSILKDFRMYDAQNAFLDTVDISLPEIAFMTASQNGAGIMGEMEIPILGLVQSMGVTVNFHSTNSRNLGLISNSKQLEFRGSEQYTDPATGEIFERAVKISVITMPKKFAPGTMAKASEMGSNYEGEISYLKILHDGAEILEVDKLNYICVVNGTNLMAKTREHLGL